MLRACVRDARVRKEIPIWPGCEQICGRMACGAPVLSDGVRTHARRTEGLVIFCQVNHVICLRIYNGGGAGGGGRPAEGSLGAKMRV